MEKQDVLEAIQQLKKDSPKRNFAQSYDFLVKLQNFDPKKNENKVDVFISLPHTLGRKLSVCGLVGGTLYNDAKANCDHTIGQDEFKSLAGNGKELKKLARKYDFFIAQADIMGSIASTFGRYLGPKGRMPNPKAGAIVPLKGSTKPIVEKLQKTVRLAIKNNEMAVRCPIGKDSMKDDEVAENILAAYNGLVQGLPQHEQNVKSVLLKLTMSKAVVLGGKK
ncbi:hypothetical protein HZA98_04445 [Candidatus Woesearchaeota archaeon]|nr:hypothetical protein [Candidatus Woesearchaeota archaeon]